MKNVTITLQEDVARWVRVRAAQDDTSVSRYVGELLRRRMTAEEGYKVAMHRFLARQPKAISEGGRYPTREELHDRPVLR